MKSARHRSREFIVQGLYDWLLTQESAAFIEQTLRDNPEFTQADVPFTLLVLRGVIANASALSQSINPHVSRDVSMINPVERAVLLMAAYELVHSPETPVRVIINEAIEVTKTFGGEDGFKFVNGVLDKLAAAVRPAEAV